MEDPQNSPPKVVYGFTLSPKPKHIDNNIHLFNVWTIRLHKALKAFSRTYTYYHEYDDSGRLHFHGYFEIYDKIKFKKNSYTLRKYGFTKYETKPLGEKWYQYISKDIEDTLKIYDGIESRWLPMTNDKYKQWNKYYKDIITPPTDNSNKWFYEIE